MNAAQSDRSAAHPNGPPRRRRERVSRRLTIALLALAIPTGCAWSADKAAAPPASALVTIAKVTNGCFSDLVRVTGFVVPRKLAVVGVDSEGSKVNDLLVRDGDTVTENQELARLQPPGAPGAAKPALVPLRAPAAGLIINVNTQAGAPASPQAGPMFKIAVGGDVELDAEVPGIHMLKLNPGATARILRDNDQELSGRVRLIAPDIDRASQLGHVRISLGPNPQMKVGMFARATIDARRSCGASVPRSALDHSTVQVVKNNVVETRRVRVGLVSDTSTEILEGLSEGEIVVADAGTSLHDGDQVRTIFVDDPERTRTR